MTGQVERAWLERIWTSLEGDLDLPGRVSFLGPTEQLPSIFEVGALASASVAVATLAVAELGARRLGTGVPKVQVDRTHAAAAFRSEARLRPIGWELPPVWDPMAGDYPTLDGWIRLHTNYSQHREAVLRVLDPARAPRTARPDDRERLTGWVARWRAVDLETQVVAAGGCAAALHTVEEWAAHAHGTVAGGEAAITLERRSRPEPSPGWDAGWDERQAVDPRASRPLAGIRVLDLTRVIAGPVATRTLAAWGAEVLRIDPPGFAEVPALLPETTVGKRCTVLDLRSGSGRARFAELVAAADVLVHGLRPGALTGLGFGDRVLRRLNPQLCIGALDAYGWTGPWAGRRGFDSLVQFSCGIAAATGGDRPVALPAQALDHATGYLLAAAVCRGLAGRYEGRPPADIRAALIGTANLLLERRAQPPSQPRQQPSLSGPGGSRIVGRRQTAWGPVESVRQPGIIDGRSGYWRIEAGPLGRDLPTFDDRSSWSEG